MSTEVVVAVITVLGVLGSAWITSRSTRKVRGDVAATREVAEGAHSAAVAARNYARPTGNGFADETTAALQSIQDDLTETRKDIGGLRSEIRTDRRTNADRFAELYGAHRDLVQRVDQLHPAPAVVVNTNPQEHPS